MSEESERRTRRERIDLELTWQIVDFDTRSLSQLTISAPLENTRRKMDRQIMHCAFPADSWHRRGQQSNPRPAECPDSSRALLKRSETLARNLRLDKPDRLEKAYERPGRRVAEETLAHHGRSSLGSQTDGPARAQCEAAQVKPDEIADLSLWKNLRTRVFRSLY
jgi:hypothetical protein